MNNGTYNLQDLYEDVDLFNKVAGKAAPKSKEDLLNQLRLVQEELNETVAAVQAGDAVESLDGAIDTAVTLFGFIKQLETLGAKVGEAACNTAYNNMSKFTDFETAQATVEQLRKSNPNQVFTSEPYIMSQDSIVWVIKDGHGKVRKPINYKKNDIARFAGRVF